MLSINASIIQESALGPVEYVFIASDLHPSSPANWICKYADDTYLVVPASNSNSIYFKRSNTSAWATANNLKLNSSKSQEMIVHLPRRTKSLSYPSATPGSNGSIE